MEPSPRCIIAISVMFLASLPVSAAVIYDEGSGGDAPGLLPGENLGPLPHDGVPGGIFTVQGTLQEPGDLYDIYVFDIPAGSNLAGITVETQLLTVESSLWIDLLAGGSLGSIHTTMILQVSNPGPHSIGQASMFPLPLTLTASVLAPTVHSIPSISS
jgi:hypothetical protein